MLIRSFAYWTVAMINLAAMPALAQHADNDADASIGMDIMQDTRRVGIANPAESPLLKQIGERQAADRVDGFEPLGRIDNRFSNRIQNRMHTRIDRLYRSVDPASAFEVAADQIRTADPRSRR